MSATHPSCDRHMLLMSCVLSPQAAGWSDVHLPLTYRFSVLHNGTGTGAAVALPLQASASTQKTLQVRTCGVCLVSDHNSVEPECVMRPLLCLLADCPAFRRAAACGVGVRPAGRCSHGLCGLQAHRGQVVQLDLHLLFGLRGRRHHRAQQASPESQAMDGPMRLVLTRALCGGLLECSETVCEVLLGYYELASRATRALTVHNGSSGALLPGSLDLLEAAPLLVSRLNITAEVAEAVAGSLRAMALVSNWTAAYRDHGSIMARAALQAAEVLMSEVQQVGRWALRCTCFRFMVHPPVHCRAAAGRCAAGADGGGGRAYDGRAVRGAGQRRLELQQDMRRPCTGR